MNIKDKIIIAVGNEKSVNFIKTKTLAGFTIDGFNFQDNETREYTVFCDSESEYSAALADCLDLYKKELKAFWDKKEASQVKVEKAYAYGDRRVEVKLSDGRQLTVFVNEDNSVKILSNDKIGEKAYQNSILVENYGHPFED